MAFLKWLGGLVVAILTAIFIWPAKAVGVFLLLCIAIVFTVVVLGSGVCVGYFAGIWSQGNFNSDAIGWGVGIVVCLAVYGVAKHLGLLSAVAELWGFN